MINKTEEKLKKALKNIQLRFFVTKEEADDLRKEVTKPVKRHWQRLGLNKTWGAFVPLVIVLILFLGFIIILNT